MSRETFQSLRMLLMEKLDLARELTDEEILEEIDTLILERMRDSCLSLKEKVQLRQELFHSVRKLDVLQELIEDETVTEIMVNGPDAIFVERAGKLSRWEKTFTSGEKLEDVIQQIVGKCNRVVNESMPIVDARLENGARVNAVIRPVALNGPILTIRRFPDTPITMEKLIALGSLPAECAEFLKTLVRARYSMVIGGGTGSGKTTFLKRIIPALKNAVVVAPTGVAAVNAGGQTIHSFFRIGMQPYIPEIRKGAFIDNCEYKFNGGSEKILQNIKYLIIDEISMVRPDLLDNVADILRHARGDKDPFGGVKLIMVGDLFQLPPVIKEDFFREIYDTSYFFSSKSLMASGMEMVSFEKIYRQKDEKFISILNKVREGQMDDDVFDTINSRCIQSDNNQGYVEIVTTNSKATAINEMRISSLPGSLRKLEAVINGDYPKDAPVEKTLFLKEGSRVMITRNGGEYFNGSLGTVLSIKKGEIEVVLDKPKDDEHTKVVITPCSFEKVKYVRNGYKIESEVVGAIIQYPIKIGYSITIHKAQGLTLDAAMMDVSNSFETGQLYTALSRVKSLDGLYLRQPIPKTVKTSDQVVINFYKRTLGNGGIVKPVPMEELEKSMINLSTGSEIDFAEFNL